MSEEVKLKIYPSSSGFVTENGLEIDYNSACPRYMVASIGSTRVELDPIYAELGALHEEWWTKKLGVRLIAREKEIKVELSDTVRYSGRADFIVEGPEVHETKASMSKTFLYQNIRKRKPKLSHLAQLVSYMIQLKIPKGQIIAGFYKEKESRLVLQEHVEFKVDIDDEGRILVDGVATPYTVAHQLAHLHMAQQALETQELGDRRPLNYEAWTGPCKMCPLNNLCWAKDQSPITDKEFKDQAKELINAQQPRIRKNSKANSGSNGKVGAKVEDDGAL